MASPSSQLGRRAKRGLHRNDTYLALLDWHARRQITARPLPLRARAAGPNCTALVSLNAFASYFLSVAIRIVL